MKIFALAAALLVSTAAIAQMAPETPTPPADTTMRAPPAQPSDMTSPPATEGAPAAPAPMGAPAPATEPVPTAVAQASYPRCSATVADQCRQSSARESDRKGGPAAHNRKRRG